jgi:hypothetical protein
VEARIELASRGFFEGARGGLEAAEPRISPIPSFSTQVGGEIPELGRPCGHHSGRVTARVKLAPPSRRPVKDATLGRPEGSSELNLPGLPLGPVGDGPHPEFGRTRKDDTEVRFDCGAWWRHA